MHAQAPALSLGHLGADQKAGSHASIDDHALSDIQQLRGVGVGAGAALTHPAW